MLRVERTTLRGVVHRVGRGERHAAVCYEASGCGYGVYRQILDAGHLCDVIAPALFREKQVSEFLSKFGDAQPPGPRHRRTGTLCAAVITLRTEAGSVVHFASAIYIRAMATSAAVGIDGPAPPSVGHTAMQQCLHFPRRLQLALRPQFAPPRHRQNNRPHPWCQLVEPPAQE